MAENSSVWCSLLEAAQDPLDLGHEAHVGHAVGFVEHEDLDVGDRQLAAVAEVDEPAGRGDDDVDAAPQRLDLALHRSAAVELEAQPARFGQRRQHLGDLHGQLAGRHEHERAGPPGSALPVRSSIGRPKARVLPEPVLALPSTSRPAQGVGDGEGLDREGLEDALFGEDGYQIGGYAEAVKRGFHG